MAGETLVVLTTWPDIEMARAATHTLVDEQLVACGNLLPGVESIYRWQGGRWDERETLAIIKTTRERFAALKERLVALHPYEVPEVIALPVEAGHEPYLGWVAS